MITFEEFIKMLRDNFHAEIAIKTGWGNQELKLAFERAVSKTLARLYEQALGKEQ